MSRSEMERVGRIERLSRSDIRRINKYYNCTGYDSDTNANDTFADDVEIDWHEYANDEVNKNTSMTSNKIKFSFDNDARILHETQVLD